MTGTIINLKTIESVSYFLLWITGVLYALYRVTLSSEVFRNYDDIYGDFTEGWFFLERRKDVADYEWETSLHILYYMVPWLVISITVSELLRLNDVHKVIPYWQVISSLSFVTYITGFTGTVAVIVQPLLFGCICAFKKSFLVWLCGILNIILVCYFKSFLANGEILHELRIDDKQHYMIVVATCWINLRCLSYFLDDVNKMKTSQWTNLVHVLSYCTYLPSLFYGPFFMYVDFENTRKPSSRSFDNRMKQLFNSLIRFGGWLLFTELCLHFVYINAFSFHPELVKKLDNWSLSGYGYGMGQLFHLKYVVLYGLSTSICKFENITAPPTPKCIGRIHLYSDMWKYFDQGLYLFLVRYIYIPTSKYKTTLNKTISSFFCFFFVYLWHGVQYYILVWALLNFLGVCMETLFVRICKMKWIHKNFIQNMDSVWQQRLICIFASPLLVISAISNFYFFAGMSIGNIFINRVCSDTLYANLCVLFFMYCCCQASTEIKRWEMASKSKSGYIQKTRLCR